MPLGLYISVPFCKTKCTYCNFASDVFSRAVFDRYVDRVCGEIERAQETAEQMGGQFERQVDSVYFGGGTPTILEVAQLERILVTPSMIDTFARCRVNRVSLGVQSFVDKETASVGRLHKREIVLDDITRLRSAGISNINVDVIAGLPHQTRESWDQSLGELISTDVPHASVYMLEVDEDSRLGRELIAGGQKYHAHFVPDDDLTAGFYEIACEQLNRAGIEQYEISNFARAGHEARHNLKYWTRQPYLGFGVDAHSMLHSAAGAIRFSSSDALEKYVAEAAHDCAEVSSEAALQEAFFLGLRLNRGIDLSEIAKEFGEDAVSGYTESVSELTETGLLERDGEVVRLTPRGRLLSNEAFERFISTHAPV